MPSRNGLSSEERMPQIDGNAFVEHLGRHVECPMTLVVRGVVDEDIGNTERICKRRNTRPSGANLTLGSRASALNPAEIRHYRRTQAYNFHH
jgi:hypothetical protein